MAPKTPNVARPKPAAAVLQLAARSESDGLTLDSLADIGMVGRGTHAEYDR
jgi:hypothetical protein